MSSVLEGTGDVWCKQILLNNMILYDNLMYFTLLRAPISPLNRGHSWRKAAMAAVAVMQQLELK